MRGKELLEKLKEHNLFVHNIEDGEPLPGIPLAIQSISTHYLMQGSDIVFVGTSQGIINFVKDK